MLENLSIFIAIMTLVFIWSFYKGYKVVMNHKKTQDEIDDWKVQSYMKNRSSK